MFLCEWDGPSCPASKRWSCAGRAGGVAGACFAGRLAAYRFEFKGQTYPLSDNGIAQVITELKNTGLQEGLRQAGEATYKKLTLGITITEFVEGQRHPSPFP